MSNNLYRLKAEVMKMVSRPAIGKVEALFIIDVIILAIAVGSYYYLDSQGSLTATPRSAEFIVTDLNINPLEAEVGESISLSVNVTNIGAEGTYSANLTVNNDLKENQTIVIAGGESAILNFTVIAIAEGDYAVEIGGLSGSFKIKPAPPETGKIILSNLKADEYEVWANEPIGISVIAQNPTSDTDGLTIRVWVDDILVETRRVELSGGETATIAFTVNATTEGKHTIGVNSLSTSFKIVPTGYHTLSIQRNGKGSSQVPFTLNGESKLIPFTELLPVGTYIIALPSTFETETALFEFVDWSDGATTPTRTINLENRLILAAEYFLVSGIASCPSLYVWNGTNYVYRADVSAGTGYLPYFISFGENHTRVFGYSDPWDYVKLDNGQIQPRNGYYDMTLTELVEEIDYIDSVKLLVVDHLPDVAVYTNYGTRKYNLDDRGTIYTVNKNPLNPVSAIYGGQDVVAQISSDWEYGIWNTLELDLGDLSNAKEIKLIVAGMVVWPSSEVTADWTAKFIDQPGEPLFPVQYMEVKNENGNWVRVPDNRQFPMLRVDSQSFVVNLTGLFTTNNYSLRINTFFDWRFDYIGVDTTSQHDILIQRVFPAYADLAQVFETSYATSTGNFTRYGEVTELLFEPDDKFVIMRKGDGINFLFNATELEPVPEGMERDYFLFVSCWFKVPGLPYLDFTVDPLPFHNMSCFPYPDTESYPFDEDHLSYLLEYNTRTVP